GGRLERYRHHHLLAAGDAAEDAPGVVAEEALRARFVAVQAAALHDAGEAVADLDPLGGIDGHHRGGDLGVELAVHRLAPARGHAAGDHADARPDRIAGLAQRVHERLEFGHLLRIRPEERVALDRGPVALARHQGADLREVAAYQHAVPQGQPLLGDDAGGDPHGGLARRGAAASARIAEAVLLPVGVVGVAGAEAV